MTCPTCNDTGINPWPLPTDSGVSCPACRPDPPRVAHVYGIDEAVPDGEWWVLPVSDTDKCGGIFWTTKQTRQPMSRWRVPGMTGYILIPKPAPPEEYYVWYDIAHRKPSDMGGTYVVRLDDDDYAVEENKWENWMPENRERAVSWMKLKPPTEGKR